MKYLFLLVILCLVLRISFGDKGGGNGGGGKHGGFDVTEDLLSSTIYISSLDEYQSGWYMASTNTDTGHFSTKKHHIRDMIGMRSSLRHIFSPAKPFRFEVIFCGRKSKKVVYACIRNQYMELDKNGGIGGNNSHIDSHSFFLGVAQTGDKHGHIHAKLYYDTAVPKHKPDILKWKIKCQKNIFSIKKFYENLKLNPTNNHRDKHREEFGKCNLINKYFEHQDKILVLNTETDASFFEMHNRFKVNQQFNLRILRPRFRQVGKVGSSTLVGATVFASTCNLGTTVMDQVFVNKRGISASKESSTTFDVSVSLEVQANFKAEVINSGFDLSAKLGISGDWSKEFSMSSTWDSSRENSQSVHIPPGRQTNFSKLLGTYGTRQLNVYKITGTTLYVTEGPCGGNGGKVQKYNCLSPSSDLDYTKCKKTL